MTEEIEDRGGCDCSAGMNGADDHAPSCPKHSPKRRVGKHPNLAAPYGNQPMPENEDDR